MKLQETMTKLGAKKVAAVASSALILGALGFAAAAGAQDNRAPKAGLDKVPGECPKAQGEANMGDRPGRGPEGERHAARRGGDDAFARPNRPRPPRAEYSDGRDSFGPPPRGEFRRGPQGYGPPQRREGDDRAFRQGPPRPGQFGEGPEGFGPPPRPEFGENGAPAGPPPNGFGGPGRPGGPNDAGVDGPPRPMGPPSFGDIDSDGNGAISKEEFEAFHVARRGDGPPRMREGRRPAPPVPGDAPAPPAEPPAAAPAPAVTPAPPAE